LQAKRALALWQQDKDNLELERDYRDVRRALIIELKGRRGAPCAAAHARV
jgi:hypothetical protein